MPHLKFHKKTRMDDNSIEMEIKGSRAGKRAKRRLLRWDWPMLMTPFSL